jgi:hypothetical protein
MAPVGMIFDRSIQTLKEYVNYFKSSRGCSIGIADGGWEDMMYTVKETPGGVYIYIYIYIYT